jgi:putative ABC transport system substrate-binding protein
VGAELHKRRKLVIALGAGALTAPIASLAQQPKKVPRVGYLTGDSPSADLPRREGFVQGLLELGYVEGQNIVVEYRTADGKSDRLPKLAAELASLKVDVVFAFTFGAVDAVKKAMPAVPVVSVTPDPVGAGLVASLARPGGMVTGFSTLAGEEMVGKLMELLKEAVPKINRLAILANPTNPFSSLALKQTQKWARDLKLTIQLFSASTPDQIEKAFAAASKESVDGLVVVPDAMLLAQRSRLAELAAKHRLPAIYGIWDHAEVGGLMAYAASRPEIFRRAAMYVDKILKGAKPGDLPVEQPTTFELVVNMKTAKALGIKIPQSILVQATKVIE